MTVSQSESALLPIYFLGHLVVHWAVYVRTLPSVRVFTAQCTHVHRPVDDEKSVEKNWEVWFND